MIAPSSAGPIISPIAILLGGNVEPRVLQDWSLERVRGPAPSMKASMLTIALGKVARVAVIRSVSSFAMPG
jgi:hypothetical protein